MLTGHHPFFFSDSLSLPGFCCQNKAGLTNVLVNSLPFTFWKTGSGWYELAFGTIPWRGHLLCGFLGRILISDSAFFLIFSWFRFSISSCLALVCVYKFSRFLHTFQSASRSFSVALTVVSVLLRCQLEWPLFLHHFKAVSPHFLSQVWSAFSGFSKVSSSFP